MNFTKREWGMFAAGAAGLLVVENFGRFVYARWFKKNPETTKEDVSKASTNEPGKSETKTETESKAS